MSLTFSFERPSDVLEDFRKKAALYNSKSLDDGLAMDCAVAGWSICDWVFERHGEQLGFTKLRVFQNYLREKWPELAYLDDINNGRKHCVVSKYETRVTSASERKGAFSQGFSRGFDTSGLVLNLRDGRVVRMEDVISAVVVYWDQYFSDNNIE